MIIELKNADEYRGYFISQFAQMERAIDLYLSWYFIKNDPEKHNQIISILIDRIPFESKRTAMATILNIRHPKINGHNSGKKNKFFTKLLDTIREMAHIRNYYAHYHPVGYQNPDNAIALVKFRDSTNIVYYSKIEFTKQVSKILNCETEIIRLKDDMRNEFDKGLEL